MKRSLIATSCWLAIIALLLCIHSSPFGTPQAPNARSLAQKPVLTSDGPAAEFTSATTDGALIVTYHSKFIEEVEDESSSWSSSLASPAFIAPDGPPKSFSGPLPGNSPSRIVTLPLRC